MGIHFDKVLDVHASALDLRATRTRILASNIANESTPGYQARDLDFKESLSSARSGSDAGLASAGGPEVKYRLPNHASQDGNTVELGVEQAEFSQNVSDFQVSLTFVNMKLKGLSKAINGQ
ncbi:flagellar basal body rod protein FlgB [Jeongeupia chitinilytica]|uniref:Flagellar basal body rod protein FlgB n=1 Tax=Jeongeupia chitinilytica TaxID=1041641 RepID=A0ABQ3GZT6_9NEIS|nr:flagellar basal body rod protein FlgB [Jeongeupia chitinilytica]GHD63399.1 flagellar basal body rod protein FlgB [Jeongeupia chitinilytica]